MNNNNINIMEINDNINIMDINNLELELEEYRLITPEEYNELTPSVAEEFVKRWLAKMGNGMCNRMVAEMLRADAKYLEKAWEKWQERGTNAGPTCDKCGEDRNAIGGRVCWTCDLDMPEFEYKHVGHYHSLSTCYCMVGREEDEEDNETEQLAQVSINGKYIYEIYYNRETKEVEVEVDGSSEYHCYPDTMTIPKMFAKLLGRDEFELTITDININGKELSDEEIDEVYDKSWNFHIGLGRLLQFNIMMAPYENKDYDDGNQPPRHTHDDGFDEYDYEDEEEWETASQEEDRRQEMAENMERQMEAYMNMHEDEDDCQEKEKFE